MTRAPVAARPGLQVHPSALCESQDVGSGTRIWAFAHVMQGAVVGEDCNVGDHAFIEAGARLGDRVTVKNGVLIWDGVTIGDDVFVGPGAVFTNDLRPRGRQIGEGFKLVPTVVQQGATLGANVTVVCGSMVGHHAMVGAGSVVAGDVAPHALVAGNPARHIGWVCWCGGRLDEAFSCQCGRRFRIDLDAGLVPG